MASIRYSSTLDVSDVRVSDLRPLVIELSELATVVASKTDYNGELDGVDVYTVPLELRITWSVGDDDPCCAPDLWFFRDVFEEVEREIREWTSNTMARPESKT